jgi:hypothetical protein
MILSMHCAFLLFFASISLAFFSVSNSSIDP